MTEPLRSNAELETRVTRAVDAADGKPSREQKLEAQIRFLADIATLALARDIRAEMAAEDNDSTGLATAYREHQSFLLDLSRTWTLRREVLRGDVAYERATLRLKQALTVHLRSQT